MKISDWYAQAYKEGWNGREWEILIDPKDIIASYFVNNRRLIKAQPRYYDRLDLFKILEREKWDNGQMSYT
jgi:hypothetical protein